MKQHDFESYDLWISPIQERRWLVLTFVIAIFFTAAILGAPRESWSATAKNCRTQTPLPANVRLIMPGIDVPEALARFAGAWIGLWGGSNGPSGAVPHAGDRRGIAQRLRPDHL